MSFATMVRSTTLVFPIVMGSWLFFSIGIRKKCILYFLCLCSGFIITLAPWTIRNYKVFHEFIPTVANGGNNFYAGSSIRYLIPIKARIPLKQQELNRYPQDVIQNNKVNSPKEIDARYWRMGWFNYRNSWNDNPMNVFLLLAYKATRFWFATDSGRYQTLILFIQIPLLLMSIIGLVYIIRSHNFTKEIGLMVMSIAYFWIIFILMFPLARYSIPILPFLAIFVSGLWKKRIASCNVI